jgi:drug/metabolite transporter (DMT)-like permease
MEKLRRIIDQIDWYIGKENFAYIIMVFTQLLWPLSFIYVNEHKVNPIETTMARGIITVVSHSLIMRYFGVSFNIRDRSDLKYLMIRCILLIIHQYTLTVMHFVLSMSVLNSIGTIGPIFVFLIDYQINGVTINKKQLLGIIGGIFGVLLTINGDFIMSLFNSNYQMQSDF